jgi:putative nucleotidyltransferase with HDIG domain
LLETLPALPKIAQEILSLNMADENSDERLLQLIVQDPAISARIIGLSNSPLFGASRKIMSVSAAASVLGLKRIKMIAMSFAMVSSMKTNRSGAMDVLNLWQHSMALALAMDELSHAMPAELRPTEEEIYLAGLLHDIGFLVLDYINPELSNRFHARLAADTGRPFEEIETEMLEVNHSELGASLAQHWNLGEMIVAVLRNHHASSESFIAKQPPLVIMADLSERLIPTFGNLGRGSTEVKIAEWESLGITTDRIQEVESAMRTRAAEIVSAIE